MGMLRLNSIRAYRAVLGCEPMTVLLISVLGAAASLILVLTMEEWLLAVLNVLDRILAALGVGTWSARLITGCEHWLADKAARRQRRRSARPD